MIQLASSTSEKIYKHVAKPLLFTQNPERVHDTTLFAASVTSKLPPIAALLRGMFAYQHPILEQALDGVHYKNPIGLAAGWDKDAKAFPLMHHVGFGFVEVGSITKHSYPGNEGTRLWRYPNSKSILVYYGLKNEGVDVIAPRIQSANSRIPIGTNIARTNSPDCDDPSSIEDYAYSFSKLADIGDYFTINVSCPNTFGGQPFHDKKRLDMLLTALDKIKTSKPVYVKISPDISQKERKSIAELSFKHNVNGFICGNLTKRRDLASIKDVIEPTVGGLSGKVVEAVSNQLLADMYALTKGQKTIIGLGGIFTGEDAYKKIRLGASLVQMVTGLIYEGPQVVGKINKELVQLLKKDGFTSVSQAIGVDMAIS